MVNYYRSYSYYDKQKILMTKLKQLKENLKKKYYKTFYYLRNLGCL